MNIRKEREVNNARRRGDDRVRCQPIHVLIELLDAHTHTERERENMKEEAIRWDFFYTAENE